MAIPVPVKLRCPLCSAAFDARTMGASYFISGVETDLRETGSIEDVRRYSVATCPSCRYSDYTWDFLAPEEMTKEVKKRLEATLAAADAPRPAGRRGLVTDFDRFTLAERCFVARGLDASSIAELALLAYYVARDLGRKDLESLLRDEAAELFEDALSAEDLPPALLLRYSYVAGELHKRAGRRERALKLLERAIAASRQVPLDEPSEELQGALDLARFARQQRAAIVHENDTVAKLEKLARGNEKDVAIEAYRILARRRGKAAFDALKKVYKDATPRERVAVLRELEKDPPPELEDLLLQALRTSAVPDEVRVAARALGTLCRGDYLDPLVAALERGVLSTESAIVDAIRRIDHPRKHERLRKVLEKWESRPAGLGFDDPDEAWRFGSDTAPLKAILYTSGESYGIELLVRDLRALEENDLWDKPPSGSPVPAALALSDRGAAALKALLRDRNPATRRWAAWVLAELEQKSALEETEKLLKDKDRVVRLEAARAVARLGGERQEAIVLDELEKLGDSDLPFALHFLVPFKSARVKTFLLDLLDRGLATPGEVYPLLGRQEEDSKTRKLLETGLDDASDETRAGAVTGLAFLAADNKKLGPSVVARLRALFDEEDQDDVRRRIVFGLARLAESGIERDSTLGFLRALFEGHDRRLRFPIALALLQLGDGTGIDVVRERAALLDESADHYDLVAPALKALARAGATHHREPAPVLAPEPAPARAAKAAKPKARAKASRARGGKGAKRAKA